jgi:LysM repeat protein
MNRAEQRTGRPWGSLLFALVILTGAILGIPQALVKLSERQFGSPFPWAGIAPPWVWDPSSLGDLFAGRLADSALTEGLVRLALGTVWIAVALFAVNVVLEVLHQVRHGGIPSPSVRGLGWSQRLSRFVASGLVVLAPQMGLAKATSVGLPVFSARAPVVEATLGVTAPAATNPVVHHSPPGSVLDSPGSHSTAQYVVQSGDSVFSIADRLSASDASATHLANAILEMNLGRRMSDGQRFTNAAYVEPGWVLNLPAGSPAPARVHPVVAGDTLWDIAEAHLDDPLRWSEIWDRNSGAEMADGRRFERPDLILPGWDLELPEPDAPVQAVRAPDAVESVTVATELETGDQAGRQITWDAGPAPVIGALPEAVSEPGAADLETSAPAVTTDHAVPITASTAVPVTAPPVIESSAPSIEGGPDEDLQMIPSIPGRGAPLGIGSAAMLSAGVLALVGMHRRRRLRGASPRARVAEVVAGPVKAERVLRSLDGGEQLVRVDLALRAAAGSLGERDRTVVIAMVSSRGEVELLLNGPSTPVAPWVGKGDSWLLPARVSIEELAGLARSVGLPSIGLVQLGVDDHGRAVWVDLEAVGHLSIDASEESADSVVRALAATIGSSAFAEVAHLISVGVASEVFLGHRSVLEVASLTEAMRAAAEVVGSSPTAEESTFSLRARAVGGEAWEPAIVLAGSGATGVVGAVEPSRGIAVVTAGATQGSNATLSDHGDRWTVGGPALGSHRVELRPIGLSTQEVDALGDLIDTACSPLIAEDSTPAGSAPVPCEHADLEMPWSILVGLMGPVEITDRSGNTANFERSKARELIAWLATHRRRASRTGARTALWEIDVRDSTFANVVSEARRTLARLVPPNQGHDQGHDQGQSQGKEWLARTMTEDLPLHGLVVTDTQVIEHALGAARGQPAEHAIAILEPAVQLIRGMPFEGTGYLWPDAEGITSNMILSATSAAVELATRQLAIGDVEGVFRSTAHGLLALPGHEELICLRMRAHAAAGDHAAVRQEWNSYERVINADPWSDGEPAPKLVALRHELLAGRS